MIHVETEYLLRCRSSSTVEESLMSSSWCISGHHKYPEQHSDPSPPGHQRLH